MANAMTLYVKQAAKDGYSGPALMVEAGNRYRAAKRGGKVKAGKRTGKSKAKKAKSKAKGAKSKAKRKSRAGRK